MARCFGLSQMFSSLLRNQPVVKIFAKNKEKHGARSYLRFSLRQSYQMLDKNSLGYLDIIGTTSRAQVSRKFRFMARRTSRLINLSGVRVLCPAWFSASTTLNTTKRTADSEWITRFLGLRRDDPPRRNRQIGIGNCW